MSQTQIVFETTAKIQDKIRARTARVGIVGLGYVGLPVAGEFAKAGYTVTGIDVSDRCVRPPISPRPSSGTPSNICVPTPLRKTNDPDDELHRVGVSEDRGAFPSGDAGNSGIHNVPRDNRRSRAAWPRW